MAIERRSFLKILGLAGLFPAAVGKEAIAEPAPPKPAKAPKPARVKRQPKVKARPFPECEVREIRFSQDVTDMLSGANGGRIRQRPSLGTVEWDAWIDPKSAAGRMIKVLANYPNRHVILRHHDKHRGITYKGEAMLKQWVLDDWTYRGERKFIRAEFISTGPAEVTYGGRPVSPRGVIRFA